MPEKKTDQPAPEELRSGDEADRLFANKSSDDWYDKSLEIKPDYDLFGEKSDQPAAPNEDAAQ